MPASTKLTRSLVDVAMGRVPADLVIQNGQWVSVQSGEIIPGSDIAIKDGHVAYVGEDASHTIGRKTKVIDAQGRYLVPGLLDGHMHVSIQQTGHQVTPLRIDDFCFPADRVTRILAHISDMSILDGNIRAGDDLAGLHADPLSVLDHQIGRDAS